MVGHMGITSNRKNDLFIGAHHPQSVEFVFNLIFGKILSGLELFSKFVVYPPDGVLAAIFMGIKVYETLVFDE